MAPISQPGLTLLLMAGPPGAGKTTLALALGRALHWPVVDKDTIKSTLLTAGVPNEIAGPASYILMHEIGTDLLVGQGLSVILDSPAGYPIVIERAAEAARLAGANLKVVLCLADRAMRDQRLAERTARPSQWVINPATDLDDEQQWRALLPLDTLTVLTTRPVAELVPEVLAYLQAQ